MLQTLKWTESVFMGLAIVLIALAVVAVPSNHVWGDPPNADPGGGTGTPDCTKYCSSGDCPVGDNSCYFSCLNFCQLKGQFIDPGVCPGLCTNEEDTCFMVTKSYLFFWGYLSCGESCVLANTDCFSKCYCGDRSNGSALLPLCQCLPK